MPAGSFPFLVTMATLVLGLAVARILGSLANLVEERRRVRFSSLFLVWAFILLFFLAFEWWEIYRWHQVTHFTFGHFIFLAVNSSLCFFVAALYVPRIPEEGAIDLRLHFLDMRKYIFPLMAIVALLDYPDTFLKGWDYFFSFGWDYHAGVSASAVILLACAFVKNERYLWVLAALALAAFGFSYRDILTA